MSDEQIPKLHQMPDPPEGAVFSLRKVEKISLPHPFMIMPGHVHYAAEHCSGRLGTDAIARSGVPCGWKVNGQRCQLSIHQHESQVTLFINVPQNRDLNAIEGLHSYLFNNKAKFEALGVQGFAFPTGGQT